MRSVALVALASGLLLLGVAPMAAQSPRLMFPDDVLPPQIENFPQQPPRMILELGDSYYGLGPTPAGVKPWSGTYWQPALWVYGDYRSLAQSQTRPGVRELQTAQWRNRFDLFANLRLSGTERILVGFRPIDDGGMTGVEFARDGRVSPGNARFVDDGLSYKPAIYFIEGDIAELFQFLDYSDMKPFDIGFTVGRQNLFFQEGLLINSIMDVVGLSFNGLHLPGLSNLRIASAWGFNNVNHGGNRDAQLFGLFVEADRYGSMLNLDLGYVRGTDAAGDGFVAGASSVQQMGFFNTAFRIAASRSARNGTGQANGTQNGVILFNEISRQHYPRQNLIYFNQFVSRGTFSPLSTDPPGPLGRVGLLYGGSPLGAFVPAMGPPVASNEVGASVGYQWMWIPQRRQFVLETGFRQGIFEGNSRRIGGAAAKVQQAVGDRFILEGDLFMSHTRGPGTRFGSRFGLLMHM